MKLEFAYIYFECYNSFFFVLKLVNQYPDVNIDFEITVAIGKNSMSQ